MTNIIQHPGAIDYKSISSAVTKHGAPWVHQVMVIDGIHPTVATVLIRRALAQGWGRR